MLTFTYIFLRISLHSTNSCMVKGCICHEHEHSYHKKDERILARLDLMIKLLYGMNSKIKDVYDLVDRIDDQLRG